MTGRDYYPMRSVAFDAAEDSGLIYLNPYAPKQTEQKQPAQAIDLFSGLDEDEELEFALWALTLSRAEGE